MNLGVIAGPDPVAVARADKLATAVRQNGTVMADIDERWADVFVRMGDTIPATRLDVVLAWYCAQLAAPRNARPLDLPTAFSANTFRRRFDLIEQCMWLHGTDDAYPKEVNNIVRRLRCAVWPAGVASRLPGVVDLTVERYRGWLQQRDAAIRGIQDAALLRFGRWLQERTLAPYHFAEVWWEEVWEDVHTRQAYDNPLRDVFEPKHKRHMAWGYRWSNEYCGRCELWWGFMAVIQGTKE